MLRIPTKVHRIRLLREADLPHRLSTRILVSAFNLYARIQLLPETHPCKQVMQIALEASGTWARTVSLHLTELEVQDSVQWNSTQSACQTPEARKRRVKKYMQEVIGPAMHAKEQACQMAELRRLPDPLPADTWRTLADAGVSHRWVLHWAQDRFGAPAPSV